MVVAGIVSGEALVAFGTESELMWRQGRVRYVMMCF